MDPPVLHSLDDGLEGDTEVDHDVDGSLGLEGLGLSDSPAMIRRCDM